MKRLIRLFILVMVVFLGFTSNSWAVRDREGHFDAGVTIDPSLDFRAVLCSIATGGELPDGSAISYRNVDTVRTTDPWRLSNQYIKVRYGSNYGSWGVRIITDNIPRLTGAQILDPAAGSFVRGDRITVSSVDYYQYSGLIGSLSTWGNPHMRATLAFQVHQNPLAIAMYPTAPTSSIISDVDGQHIQDSGVGAYGQPWGYIGDKTFRRRNADGSVGADAFDDRIYIGLDILGRRMYNDNLILYGGPGTSGGTLSSHIPVAGAIGDYEIAVYLAGRFASTDYGATPDSVFTLPPDTYGTRIWIELLHDI